MDEGFEGIRKNNARVIFITLLSVIILDLMNEIWFS